MEKNSKKTFSKFQMNSTLLIIGLTSPLLMYAGLYLGVVWLSTLAAGLFIGNMAFVIFKS